jgi:FtsP/CotA-like multicopper oxidase with cupredoxin domain
MRHHKKFEVGDMRKIGLMLALLILPIALMMPGADAHAEAGPTKMTCARPEPGSVVPPPPDLYSSKGVLNVALNYVTSLDANNLTLLCFMTPDGIESPTLHVNPGDTLNITLTNTVPRTPSNARHEPMAEPLEHCGADTMEVGAVNIHFHGMNVAPKCHSDEVIRTMVNPGETFTYSIAIPKDEPPGMYWYHPHVHGTSSADVQAGATGAIVVEGIENVQPQVAKLPSRILVMRDQKLLPAGSANSPNADGPKTPPAPSWDVSINYVPIVYPSLVPATMIVPPGRKEFWRVVNASADTIDDLVLKFDGVAQTVQIVALDGVATGSQDSEHHGKLMPVNDVYIPPAGRAEFIIPPIPATVKHVTLETLKIDTGPAGDVDIHRVLAVIHPGDAMSAPMASMASMPDVSAPPGPQRFEDLDKATVTAVRHLYFSEIFPDPNDPDDALFYITVKGQTPELFDPNAPPAITTTQGAVEDWVIENQTQEVHEFHIHQIHFQLREISGVPVPIGQRQFRDTFQVPYWSGKGPYPSIKVRMDFRGKVVGDFVYHCHILDHEDRGMMAIIRVQPATK